MEVSQLRYFLAASETLSFARAAQQCFTSRQNLAHSIQVLERELGIKLFRRSGNSMMLTPEGEQTVARAKDIVAAIEELSIAFVTPGSAGASLRVVFGTNLISCASLDIIGALDNFSDSTLLISEYACEAAYRQVVDGQADLAVVPCMKRSFPECESAVLQDTPFYALASVDSALHALERLEVRDLAGHTLLLLSEPGFQYGLLLEEYERCGLKRDAIEIIPSTSTMVRMVRRHDALAIVAEQFHNAAPQGTVAIPFADPRMRWFIYALFQRSSEKRQSVLALLKYLKTVFAQDANAGTGPR